MIDHRSFIAGELALICIGLKSPDQEKLATLQAALKKLNYKPLDENERMEIITLVNDVKELAKQ